MGCNGVQGSGPCRKAREGVRTFPMRDFSALDSPKGVLPSFRTSWALFGRARPDNRSLQRAPGLQGVVIAGNSGGTPESVRPGGAEDCFGGQVGHAQFLIRWFLPVFFKTGAFTGKRPDLDGLAFWLNAFKGEPLQAHQGSGDDNAP